MKKTLVTLLALVFVLGIAGTALAAPANPFVDVPAKHWAYGAVAQLAKAGIVDGYGDGSFRGDRSMTRYEMAQVVAKAMAKSDKADAEQKALIDKLAVEFAAELNNLGVRVAKLEANQPNIQFKGAAWIRYTADDFTSGPSSVSAQYRLRLDGTAKVDDKTSFNFRFVNREPDKAHLGNDTWQTFGESGQSGAKGTYGNQNNIDRINLTTKLGDLNMTLGRQSMYVDQQNMIMDSGAFSFDGVKLNTKFGDLGFTVQYGRFYKGAAIDSNVAGSTRLSDLDVTSAAIDSKLGKFAWAVSYTNMNNPVVDTAAFKWTLFDTKYTFDTKWTLQALYLHNGAEKIWGNLGTNAYAAKLTFGDFVLNKTAAQNLQFQYVNAKGNATWFGFSGLDTSIGGKESQCVDWKMYLLQYNYAFSKSFNASLIYAQVDPTDAADKANEKKHIRVVTNVLF